MAIQARAARTREELVYAAAVEFDQVGYEGARLARVCTGAAVSMGALTFHFSSKAALADAVQEEGRVLTEAALVGRSKRGAGPERAAESESATDSATDSATESAAGPELEEVVALTVRLVGLVEENVVVRSAVRLSTERPQAAGAWTEVWLPRVTGLLEQARNKGHLRTDEDLQAVAVAVPHLVEGAVSGIRIGRAAPADVSAEAAARAAAGTPVSASDQVRRIWRLILRGLAA